MSGKKIHPRSKEGVFLAWLQQQTPGHIFSANDAAKATNSTPTNIGHFCRLYPENIQSSGKSANGITRLYVVVCPEIPA